MVLIYVLIYFPMVPSSRWVKLGALPRMFRVFGGRGQITARHTKLGRLEGVQAPLERTHRDPFSFRPASVRLDQKVSLSDRHP